MATIELNNPDPDVLDGRHIRASAFEAAQRELLTRLHQQLPAADPQFATALAVGAGYSRLPQLMLDVGYHVTAVDPSADATRALRAGYNGRWPTLRSVVGDAKYLPAEADSIDLVWCVDTLEIVSDVRPVFTEISRVLRPGGVVILDTLNNTALSRVIYLRLFQQAPGTRIMPPGRYTAARLWRPDDLSAAARAAGLRVAEVIGYEPRSPIALLSALLRRRSGRIGDEQLSDLAGFRLSTSEHTPPVTYYAIARAE